MEKFFWLLKNKKELLQDINFSKKSHKRVTIISQGPENVLYDIFMNPETKSIVEASGHIYAGTKITRWIS